MSNAKSFDEVLAESEMTSAEKASLAGQPGDVVPNAAPQRKVEGAPDWVVFPSDLAIPPGREIRWAKFKAEWTDTPQKGDRHCILWSLSDRDEVLAAKRARGDRERGLVELAKGGIRAVDGVRADWTGAGGAGSVDRFWTEIGSKCRQMLLNDYFKTSALSVEEQADFFQSCYGVARASVG